MLCLHFHPFPIFPCRSKFQSRRYASLDDLAADLYLMLQNCEDYNQPDSFFGDEARRLREVVDSTLATLQ